MTDTSKTPSKGKPKIVELRVHPTVGKAESIYFKVLVPNNISRKRTGYNIVPKDQHAILTLQNNSQIKISGGPIRQLQSDQNAGYNMPHLILSPLTGYTFEPMDQDSYLTFHPNQYAEDCLELDRESTISWSKQCNHTPRPRAKTKTSHQKPKPTYKKEEKKKTTSHKSNKRKKVKVTAPTVSGSGFTSAPLTTEPSKKRLKIVSATPSTAQTTPAPNTTAAFTSSDLFWTPPDLELEPDLELDLSFDPLAEELFEPLFVGLQSNELTRNRIVLRDDNIVQLGESVGQIIADLSSSGHDFDVNLFQLI